jgi:uncharacterized protein YlxP (DUF503 family)
MLVALQRFDLRIPGSTSLKYKRHVVKTLTVAIRQRFAVSVAEIDYQDLWQRTAIAVAAVGASEYHLRRVMQEVSRMVEGWQGAELIDAELQLLSPDD